MSEDIIQELKSRLENPARAKQRKEQQAKAQRQSEALTRDFNRTFSSQEGKRVLKWLLDYCGYSQPLSAYGRESGLVLKENIIHNAALHGLYAQLRKFLQEEILIDVEIRSDVTKSDLFR